VQGATLWVCVLRTARSALPVDGVSYHLGCPQESGALPDPHPGGFSECRESWPPLSVRPPTRKGGDPIRLLLHTGHRFLGRVGCATLIWQGRCVPLGAMPSSFLRFTVPAGAGPPSLWGCASGRSALGEAICVSGRSIDAWQGLSFPHGSDRAGHTRIVRMHVRRSVDPVAFSLQVR
jgi:hypothetical protein